MRRSIIPLIAILLFFLEPVFSLFSPIAFNDHLFTLVPRFVIVSLIFTAIYDSKKHAIIYGIILGLLYDMFYIDIIGLYAFLYPLLCVIAVGAIHYVHRHIVTVSLLTMFLIAFLEFFSYGFASLISVTSIGFDEFLRSRLFPTLIGNLLFVIMFGWFFKKVIEPRFITHSNEIL